ncbi:MAG TPA: hypothetical protein VFH45_13000 [Acidimicrobiales bacterium]|nr:hypothetical protein [Acidimicrobiales bacterium]
MDPVDAARSSATAVVELPSRFMMDPATYTKGGNLGFNGADFYIAGRGGALGEVDGTVVAAAFVFFNPESVCEAWERSAPVAPRRKAAEAFAEAAHEWADRKLPAEGIDYPRLAELAGKACDAASVSAAPLFAGWRALPEPSDPRALALHRMNGLRELRGAYHGAAVLAVGLTPLQAVLYRTPHMVGIFGWGEGAGAAGEKGYWDEAEAITNRMFAVPLEGLSDAERSQFVELARAALEQSA